MCFGNPAMAIADESHGVQSHVDDGCGTVNVAIYGKVNPTKILDEDEDVDEAVSGLVNTTKNDDEGNVETTHEAVCLDGVSPEDEDDDDLLATKVELRSPKYDVEHLYIEGWVSICCSKSNS